MLALTWVSGGGLLLPTIVVGCPYKIKKPPKVFDFRWLSYNLFGAENELSELKQNQHSSSRSRQFSVLSLKNWSCLYRGACPFTLTWMSWGQVKAAHFWDMFISLLATNSSPLRGRGGMRVSITGGGEAQAKDHGAIALSKRRSE